MNLYQMITWWASLTTLACGHILFAKTSSRLSESTSPRLCSSAQAAESARGHSRVNSALAILLPSLESLWTLLMSKVLLVTRKWTSRATNLYMWTSMSPQQWPWTTRSEWIWGSGIWTHSLSMWGSPRHPPLKEASPTRSPQEHSQSALGHLSRGRSQ